MVKNSIFLTEAEQSRVSQIRLLESQGNANALFEMLTDSSWGVRREVTQSLAALGNSSLDTLCFGLVQTRNSEAQIAAMVDALVLSNADVETRLFELAHHQNAAVVADVAQILGRRRNVISVPVLIQLLEHADDNVAVGAIEGLGKIGGRAAIEALIRSTQSGNFFRTFPAIDVLGRSGDPRVVEPLAELLKNPTYLPEAAKALGRSGEKSAIKVLIELVQSPSNTVIRIAAVALAELKDRMEERSGGNSEGFESQLQNKISGEALRRLARILIDTNGLEAVAICKLLGIAGSAEAVPQLIGQLDRAPMIAEAAANSLGKIGQSTDDYLRLAIREGSSERRKILLPLITRIAAAEEVALCLEDSDSDVRVSACETLQRLGASSMVKFLFPLIESDDLRVIHAAVAAIQSLGSREARVLAVELSKSENTRARRAALNILAYYGDASATEPMLQGLMDPDQKVKEAAIQGLPLLEDQRAIEALFEMARDSNQRIKSLAMRSIGQIPKSTVRAHSVLLKGIKDPDPWVRYYACQSLGRLSITSAAPDITALLDDEAGQVRLSAVEALSHLDTPEAHAALSAAMKTSEADVKRAALVGLGIAKRLEDLPLILSEVHSKDSPTRLIALSALVNFNSPEVFPALQTAAADADEQVRAAAIGFLAARSESEATVVLINLMKVERSREKAMNALMMARPGRIDGILAALANADDELAPELVNVMMRLSQYQAREGLLAAIKMKNTAARKAAATGIAALRADPSMLSALKDGSENDPDRQVRQIFKLLLNE